MQCKGCEQRRVHMRLMIEAGKQWAEKPLGPNVREIYLRLVVEAIARGELEHE